MDYSRRKERYAANYPENEEVLAWLRQEVEEPVLEPEMPIVDAHHHMWDRRRDSCKYRTIVYGIGEVLEDMYDGHNVVGTVYCQAKCYRRCAGPPEFRPVAEIEFCQGLAASCEAGLYGPEALKDSCVKVCWGIVGECDLRHPNAEAVLAEMMRCRNFRGIRGNGPYDEDFKRGFRALEKNGLTFDVWHNPDPAYVPGELPKLAALAQEFPSVTIVLNHLGGLVGPGIGGPSIESIWRTELAELASSCPNVVCKVGGILMPKNGFGIDKRPKPAGSEELAELTYPWFSHAIECFGPARCMFQSNFPVDKDSVTYRTIWNMFKRVAAKKGLTYAQKKDIFHDTAVRVYKLSGATHSEAEPSLKRLKVS